MISAIIFAFIVYLIFSLLGGLMLSIDLWNVKHYWLKVFIWPIWLPIYLIKTIYCELIIWGISKISKKLKRN